MISPSHQSPKGRAILPSLISIGALAALSMACGGGGGGSPDIGLQIPSASDSNTPSSEKALTHLPKSFVPDSLVSLQKSSLQQKASIHPRAKVSKNDDEANVEFESNEEFDEFDEGFNSGAYEELQYMLDRISTHRGELAIQYVLLDQVLPQIREFCGESLSCEIPANTYSVELNQDVVAAILELAQGDDVLALEPGESIELPVIKYENLPTEKEYQECVDLIFSDEESLRICWSENRQLLKMVDSFNEEGYKGTVTYISDASSGTFSLTQDVEEDQQRYIESILIKENSDITTFEASQQSEGIESYQVTSSGNLSPDGGELISTFAWQEYPLIVSSNLLKPIFLSEKVGQEEFITGYHDGFEGWYWGDPSQLDQMQVFKDDVENESPISINAGDISLGDLVINVEQVRERFSTQGDVLEVAFRDGTQGTWTVENPDEFEEEWEPEELFKGAELSEASFLDVNNLAIIVPAGTQVDSKNIWEQAIGIAFAIPALNEGDLPEVFVNVWADNETLSTAQVYLLDFSQESMSISLKDGVYVTPGSTQEDDDYEHWEEDGNFDEDEDFDEGDDFEGDDQMGDSDLQDHLDENFNDDIDDNDSFEDETDSLDFDELEDDEGWEDFVDDENSEFDELEELDEVEGWDEDEDLDLDMDPEDDIDLDDNSLEDFDLEEEESPSMSDDEEAEVDII